MKLCAFLALPLVVLAVLAVPALADVSKLNEAGKAAYERGDFATAERLFREAIRAAPEEPLLHYHLAVVLTRLGQWKEAKEAYERTLALGPASSLAAAAREGLRTVTPLTRSRSVAPAAPDPDPGSRRAVWRREAPSDTIKATRIGNNWYVDVVVNDGRPARFLVDTGASACLVSLRLAEALGITPGPGARVVTMIGIGGRTSGPLVTLQSVRVGDVEATNVLAVVHDAGAGDGILGNTFLSRFTMTLDPQRGLLTLQPK
jgi:clan AA aspartic protease (TIGR02281 family)